MSLEATPSGMYSNSYWSSVSDIRTRATTLSALAYLGISTTALVAASDAQVEAAAVFAADRVDQGPFVGRRALSTQSRAFPRLGTGQSRYEGAIPDAVKDAQVAEVCAMLSSPSDLESYGSEGVQSYSIGSKSVAFKDGATADSARRSMSEAARKILRAAGLLMSGAASLYLPRT